MRQRRLTVALALPFTLALVAASCEETPTGLGSPPTGLTVSLATSRPPDGATDAVTITAAGDSVIADAVMDAAACSDYRAVAGQLDGALVVTVVETFSDRICISIRPATTFRAVVRPAPRGEYRVEYRVRVAWPQQAPRERVLGTQSVSLP